jgi:putative drug exporter of the RND superfamily
MSPRNPMATLTRWVLSHKKVVVAVWAVLAVAGVAAMGPASESFQEQVTLPGKEATAANARIVASYGNGGDVAPLVPVVTLPEGRTVDSPGARADLATALAKVKTALPGARIASYASTRDRTFVSADGRTTFALVYIPATGGVDPGQAEARRAQAALEGVTVGGAPVHVTGIDALRADAADSGEKGGASMAVEALIAGGGALLVLAFVFASWMAIVPMLMALVAIPTTFLAVLPLASATDVSVIVKFLIALVGLAIAIDYALLIVVRWREERENGLSNDEAVIASMKTAGRAVVFSGTTVAVGLLALIVLPLPFLRSMGYGGLLIPLVATLVALTLLPVILASAGPRLDKRRIRRRRDSGGIHFWQRWSEAVVRRRGIAALLAIGLLVALVLPATNLHMGNSDPDTIAKAGPAKQALDALDKSGIGKGAIAPVETIVPQDDAEKVAAAQSQVDDVHGAVAPTAADWRRGDRVVVAAVPLAGDESQTGRDAVESLRNAAHDASPQARVGGSGPLNADFIDAVYGAFPLMIALISLLTFLLLARAFRSLLLPLKAVVLNVFSVGAAWGVMTLVWQNGHGSDEIWGIAATGSISSWIPLIVFAFLYGLSMDYEVFILARIREEYDKTRDTDEAVVYGLARTGRLVTSAALILFLTFSALASGPETDVKILATGLAAGILLDATVIRALLVPAVVSLFGRWNWWLPPRAARLLRVAPSPEPAQA